MASPYEYDDDDDDDEDYSPSATVITFPRPIPPLRVPLPAANSFILAFPSPQSFSSALQSSHTNLVSQCESGARIGCALSASSRCKPPWWHSLLGSPPDFTERARCEERETAACFEAAKEKCVGFAKEKCVLGFRDARVGGGRERKGEFCKGSDLFGSAYSDDFLGK